MNNANILSLWDCCCLIAKDLPNLIISVIIITFVVFCTSYTAFLSLNKNNIVNNCFKLIYKNSYNKIVGYVILLIILDLTHVVIGNYEFNGIDFNLIHIPANHNFYNIYMMAFTILFFKETILTLKNINKLGINLNSIIEIANKIDKKLDKSIIKQV